MTIDHLILAELESEWNAQFDSVREAYAGSALDPIYEGWCDHCNQAEQDGVQPLSFDAYKAECAKPHHVRYAFLTTAVEDDYIPF